MNVLVNIPRAIGAVVSGTIAWATVTESIDLWITFAGEDNAMAFFFMACIGTFGFACTAVQLFPKKMSAAEKKV